MSPTVPLPTVTNKLRLLPALLAALRRHQECPSSEIDVKAELLLDLHCETPPTPLLAELAAGVAANAVAHVDAMPPSLPDERRAALLEEARATHARTLACVATLREQCAPRIWPDPALLNSLALELRAQRAEPTTPARSASAVLDATAVARKSLRRSSGRASAGRRRGCAVSRAASCARPQAGKGVKAEFDALVVESGRIAWIVEAKAGSACLVDDLPRLLAARKVLAAAEAVDVRVGRGGVERLAVPAAPALAYVIGAAESFDDAFARSAAASTRGALVDGMMRASGSDMSWLAPCEGGGGLDLLGRGPSPSTCSTRSPPRSRARGERGEFVRRREGAGACARATAGTCSGFDVRPAFGRHTPPPANAARPWCSGPDSRGDAHFVCVRPAGTS